MFTEDTEFSWENTVKIRENNEFSGEIQKQMVNMSHRLPYRFRNNISRFRPVFRIPRKKSENGRKNLVNGTKNLPNFTDHLHPYLVRSAA
jgi:hypothetical protein